MFYLLDEPMKTGFDETIRKRILEVGAEGLVLDWLIALHEQNERYDRWQKQKILTPEDLQKLKIPLKIPCWLVPDIYNKAKKLVEKLQSASLPNHLHLLESIQPTLAKAYVEAATEENLANALVEDVPKLIKKAQQEFFINQVEPERIIGNAPVDNLGEHIGDAEQTPAEAAIDFLKKHIAEFSPKLQVSLIARAQYHFQESAMKLSLLGDPVDPSMRRDLFLAAVNEGCLELVERLLEEEAEQSLEQKTEDMSLIHVRDDTAQTALHLACQHFDRDMIALLIKHGADPQAYNHEGQTVLEFCLSEFNEKPLQVAATVRCLCDHTAVLLNATSPTGDTPLHFLVKMARQHPEEVEPLIDYLIRKGASLSIMDHHDHTALDLAIAESLEGIVEQLIQRGAGQVLNVERAQEFFRKRHFMKGSYERLKSQSPPLRWHLALEALRNKCPDDQTFYDLKGISATLNKEIHLPLEITGRLLDEKKDICRTERFGRSNVHKMPLEEHTIFIKQDPEFPELEYAVEKLFELLIGHGVSLTNLAKLATPGPTYPILISHGIEGDNLHDVLRNPDSKQRLAKLDELAFSELVLASFLVNFEDAKPDNFILERLPHEDKYRLVNIDKDRVFVPPVVKNRLSTTIQVKCILYCLDLMDKPIHPAARNRFLAIKPEHLLKHWLEQLDKQNELYLKLSIPKDPKVVFKQGAIVELYQKLQRLQIALKQSPKLSGMELLKRTIPSIGNCYEEAFLARSDPLKRFLYITQGFYKETNAGSFASLRTGPEIKAMFSPEQSPKQALEELNGLQTETRISTQELEFIRDALQDGTTDHFVQLKLDKAKEQVVNGMPGGFEGVDFGRMLINGRPDDLRQQKVLSALLTGYYQSIRLRGCSALDWKHLQQLLLHSPQLSSLELCNCSKVDQWLRRLQDIQNLNRLRLVDLELKNICLLHPTLQRLEIVRCRQLQSLTICDTLKSLSIEYCDNLGVIKAKHCKKPDMLEYQLRQYVRPSNLDYLRSWLATQQEASTNFRLKRLQLKACPKLQPWCTQYFKGYLEKDPAHEIQLKKVPPSPIQRAEPLLLEAVLRRPRGEVEKILPVLWKACTIEEIECLKSTFEQYDKAPDTGLDLSQAGPIVNDLYLKVVAHKYPGLTSVDLSDCLEITDSGLRALVRGCGDLVSINLHGCQQITDKGLQSLGLRCLDLTSIDLTDCWLITDAGLEGLVEGCPNLTSINLHGCKAITKTGLRVLVQGCPNLSCLNITDCWRITDDYLETLAAGQCSLTDINLTGCTSISDAGLQIFIEKHPDLKCVNLSGCEGVSDASLESLVAHCSKLTDITLTGCWKVTHRGLIDLVQKRSTHLRSIDLRGWRKITDEGLKAIASCPNLTHIHLSFYGKTSDDEEEIKERVHVKITDLGLIELVKGCRKLTHLSLLGCNWITDNALRTFANNCNLRTIDLEGCTEITDAGLEALAECSELTSINIARCLKVSDGGLQALVSGCKKFTSVNLAGCVDITNATLRVLRQCPNLRSIDLTGCIRISDSGVKMFGSSLVSLHLQGCTGIENQGLMILSERCPNLTLVNLKDCWITDQELQQLKLPKLSEINLHNGQKITDEGLLAIAKNCPHLLSIDLTGCVKVTDIGIRDLAQHCCHLRSLSLSGCPLITGSALQALAKGCPHLKKLNLARCSSAIETGLQILLESCSNLSVINLEVCEWISDAHLQIFQRCPNLVSLNLTRCWRITNNGLRELFRTRPKLTVEHP